MNPTLEPISITQSELVRRQITLSHSRPQLAGKFLRADNDKFYIRGVTYGPFRPEQDGSEYHTPGIVARDFEAMVAQGINSVRTYTVPPAWLLDLAQLNGLRVLVGIPWEQHVMFLDNRAHTRDIERRVRAAVRLCAGHPALLGYAVGNEIPATIVRWYGARRVEKFIERLYHTAKEADPTALVTYVNYPSTEYLSLPFLDFVSFNVYLESPGDLNSYLARLQNIAGERPLVLAEIGLDSARNGLQRQARTLDWQIRSVFEAGSAGAFVFAWTDEWYRGGLEVEDWDFGLTDRARQPKPALQAVARAFAETPLPSECDEFPRISVVVCSYNGSRTIAECCEALLELEYPNYEIIVVDDGSRDRTAAIASEYGFRVIRTENRGLSHARNVGMRAATGEIVAYIDDDTRPDRHWLTYLAHTFMTTNHAAVGGPNIAPPGDGAIAECVAHSPGNPVHVLLSDREAEHLPGCNLAVRKLCLEAIGGFDPQFRVAGDDVDVCWRLQERGWTLGFNPAAFVWHHRRSSIRAYWNQQKGYGNAEALLERKYPEKYNAVGHFTWGGRVYGNGLRESLQWSRQRIYQGVFGSALFQSVYDAPGSNLWWLPLMPEWYLVMAALGVLSLFGFSWTPMFVFALPFAIAGGLLLGQAGRAAQSAVLSPLDGFAPARWSRRGLILFLHLAQPLARLLGRRWDGWFSNDRRLHGFALPRPRTLTVWSKKWHSAQERLEHLERQLLARHWVVARGGAFDRWDMEVRAGLLSSVRLLMAIEEHGEGRQLVRLRVRPRWAFGSAVLVIFFTVLATGAALNNHWWIAGFLAFLSIALVARSFQELATALRHIRAVFESMQRELSF